MGTGPEASAWARLVFPAWRGPRSTTARAVRIASMTTGVSPRSMKPSVAVTAGNSENHAC